ncbi:MAG: hypothetical protein ACTSRE_11070 [Promethearchaeota archaeon]
MSFEKTVKPPQARSVAIDVFKGWGVWFMFLIHAFVQQICQFDASLFLPTIQRVEGLKKVVLLIFGLPIGVMAIWGFMFGFAFACTVAMQTMKLVDTNPKKIPKYLVIKAITGVLIVLLNKFGHTLFRGKYFKDGQILFPGLSVSYSTDILDAVAWLGVLVPLIVWLFYGLFRIKNPINLVITFVILLTGWFALTPTILKYGEMAIGWSETNSIYIIKWVLTKFIRGRFRLVPGLAYGFMGCVYATLLYHKLEFKQILRFSLLFFTYCMIGCAIWWLFIEPNWIARFAEETIPIPLTIISLSTQQLLLLLFIRNQDYAKTEAKRVSAARRTTFWRRYSIFSLTGYAINTAIARKIYAIFVGFWGSSVDYSTSPGIIVWNAWQGLVFVFFMWGFWEIVVRIWSRYDYKFSLDWFLVQMMAMLTGVKKGRSAVKPIIYGPNNYQFQEIAPLPLTVKVVN